MNAFARGNVANATRTLTRLRSLIERCRKTRGEAAGVYFGLIDEDLVTAIEDLERAVMLDEMTEAAE